MMPKRLAVIVAAILMFAPNAQASSKVPADVSAFVEDVGTALKKGQSELEMLSTDPKQLAWMNHTGRRGGPSWKTSAIAIPVRSGPSSYLAVFSDFHGVQSTADHFHLLVKTSDGWRLGNEIPERDTRGYRVRDHQLVVAYDLPNNGC